MRPHEVAEVFRVHVRTVSRWALVGNLSCVRTPGDERRFSREQVEYVKNGGAWGPRKVGARRTVRPERVDGGV
ncbi:excisionase family DNA-binding protein [Actinomadura decatromicini]|uniref:MerR family DNA-binding transcriptional regulator n=1 Tax=Actinomadura decatromicini TaxID=2604572 RepID=A0A5D3FZD7_9ACTN|nr:excisionase family DNA-binding protein [Actinomadura decatromicini]TYK53554.1 MerR family DNA-binding transcriptional regulator [Actinomadura decatromicini]